MSQANFEQWQRNLDSKIREVEAEIFHFISSNPNQNSSIWMDHQSNTYSRARREIGNLAAMYGSGNLPPEIPTLFHEVEFLHQNRDNPRSLPAILAAIEAVKRIPKTGTNFVSFHDIYEKYREDGELNDLVDQLVQTLEKIIEEDDGSLSSKVEKDINRLLDQIRNRPKLSTYEIGAWSELTGRFLLELVGQQQGIPALSMVMDGIKLAKKVFDNVFEKYQASQSEYVRLVGLKSAPESFSSLPPLSEANIQAAEFKATHSQPARLPSASGTPHPPASEPAAVPASV